MSDLKIKLSDSLSDFNLEKALNGAPVFTESGVEVEIWKCLSDNEIVSYTDRKWPLLGREINGSQMRWTKNGFYNHEEGDSHYNLRMRPPVKEYFVPIYEHPNRGLIFSHSYSCDKYSIEEAERMEFSKGIKNFIKIISIEIEG